MKKLLLLIMAVAAFGLVTGNMRAQSSAASVNPQGVIVVTNASGGLTTITNPILAEIPAAYQGTVETVLAWASSVNTNLSYGRVIGWTGPVYQNGVNIADEIGMSYDLYTSSATDGYFVAAEARFRNAGVLGTIVSAGGGIEAGWLYYDIKTGPFADVGALLYKGSKPYGEFGWLFDKMMTQSSIAGVFISWQTGQSIPIVGGTLNLSFDSGNGVLGLFGKQGSNRYATYAAR